MTVKSAAYRFETCPECKGHMIEHNHSIEEDMVALAMTCPECEKQWIVYFDLTELLESSWDD